MFGLHTPHHRTSGCAAKRGLLAGCPHRRDREREGLVQLWGIQWGWDGSRNWVGGKLKSRVQERTEEDIIMEKSIHLTQATNSRASEYSNMDKKGLQIAYVM